MFGLGLGGAGGGGGGLIVVDESGLSGRNVGIGRSNSMAHSRPLSSSSSSFGSIPLGLGFRVGSSVGGKVGFGGGFGFLGSEKSLGASIQSSRHGLLQKRRHGFPHLLPGLRTGLGFPGFHVGVGNQPMRSSSLLVIVVGFAFGGV